MGDSPWRCKLLAFCRNCSIARYRGLESVMVFGPGVYTPGFMLTPAPQAKSLDERRRKSYDCLGGPR